MVGGTALIPIHDENPTRSLSWLTLALIALNVIAFIMEPSFGSPPAPRDAASAEAFCRTTTFFYRWGTVPREITSGNQVPFPIEGCPSGIEVGDKSIYLSLLTSMFLHGGFLHIAGNMLFLWVFGNNIEDRLGRFKYLIFYLVCGVAASLAHIYTNTQSVVPSIGASGAVAGLLGAYLVLFPHARITTIVPLFFFLQVVRLPAVVVLGLWFVYQFFIGAAQQIGEAGVAWMAHVGGFVTGLILIIPFGGRGRRRPVQELPW